MLKDKIKEIGNLILLHFRQNWPYALAVIATFTICTAYMYIDAIINVPDNLIEGISVGHYKELRKQTNILFIVMTWLYSFITIFKGYARRQRLHDTLMLPANRSSKFAVEILCSLVIVPATLIAIWATVDAIDIIRNGFPAEYHSMEWFYRSYDEEGFWYALAFIFSVHGLITLWQASHNIKLIIGICVVAFGMLLISANTGTYYPFTYGNIRADISEGVATSMIQYVDVSLLPIGLAKNIQFIVFVTMPFALYILAYYKFKERNVR